MTVILNKQLEISDIKITDNQLALPQDITILSQELNDQILSALQTGQPPQNTTLGNITYKVTDVYKIADTSSSVKAQVTVVFNEALSCKTSVLSSDKGPWVNWPEEFIILNNGFRKLIDKMVIMKQQ
jgi:hypothetical protein